MTGEMYAIRQDGVDSNGDCWAVHAAVARAVHGRLMPFDVYQGPYIVVGDDVVAGDAPYAVPVQHLGIVRLWLGLNEDDLGFVYREDTDETLIYGRYDDTRAACRAARELLKRGECHEKQG